ncbi:MAG TPA: FAD-binding protein, partial [Flavitalea sp.]|nr:FAD-binding protein [Flavitalea sp.]
MKENQSLKEFNTFGINTFARYYSSFTSLGELEEIVASNSVQPLMILGGGSNVLFTKNFDGLVLKNDIKGIDIVKEDDDFAIVRAGAGESWHDLVLYTLEN